VQVEIDAGGLILDYSVIESSGRSEFDNSAMRAVEDTSSLPEPPGDIRTLVIDFNLQDML